MVWGVCGCGAACAGDEGGADTQAPDAVPDGVDGDDGADGVAPDDGAGDGEIDEADATDATDGGPDIRDGWTCVLDPAAPDAGPIPFAESLGCSSDFATLAAPPLDAALPGARALKTVVDRADSGHLYFTNVTLYPVHYDFCRAYLSGHGLPPVSDLGTFNASEYYAPQRRFLLGALTFYEGANAWVYELAPYDTASSAMITTAFQAIRTHAYVGADLKFHPTSSAIETRAAELSPDIPVITTTALLGAMRYQPLALGKTTGRLRFVAASTLTAGAPGGVGARDVVVLDAVAEGIGIAAGTITGVRQAPAGALNARALDRRAPNMALVGAWEDAALRALDGQWVELRVGAFDWEIHAITEAEANAWWTAHPPPTAQVPRQDTTRTELVLLSALLPPSTPLATALEATIPAYGATASHLAAAMRIGPNAPVTDGIAVPIHAYAQHLVGSGLDAELGALLADPDVTSDPIVRKARLEAFQAAIIAAPLDADFVTALTTALAALPSGPLQVASSTNAEDLPGFVGAALGATRTTDPDDPARSLEQTIKTIWASAWSPAAFDERAYRSIVQADVGMALVLTPAPAAVAANGVALSANVYDLEGFEPAFVIDAQTGDAAVTSPAPDVTHDRILYYWYYPGQPQLFLSRSSLVAPGAQVLTNTQVYQLGRALDALHTLFAPVHQAPQSFYGLEVGFTFAGPPGDAPTLVITSARPYPGWGP